jgi:hypothetical protein
VSIARATFTAPANSSPDAPMGIAVERPHGGRLTRTEGNGPPNARMVVADKKRGRC